MLFDLILSRAYTPASSDWDTLVTIGATASWGVIVRALLNPGEGFFADSCKNFILMEYRMALLTLALPLDAYSAPTCPCEFLELTPPHRLRNHPSGKLWRSGRIGRPRFRRD